MRMMGVMGTVATLMAVNDVLVAVPVLWLFADEAEEAVDKQTQENPNCVEDGCGHEHIKDRRPEL